MNGISITLNRNDWGQIIDGLEVRLESWEATARYLEGEEVNQIIEECHDAAEARSVAATYERLIEDLNSQLHG